MFRVCDVYMDPDEMGDRYKVMAIAPRRKDGLFFLDSVEETTRKKKKKKGDAVSVCRQVENLDRTSSRMRRNEERLNWANR